MPVKLQSTVGCHPGVCPSSMSKILDGGTYPSNGVCLESSASSIPAVASEPWWSRASAPSSVTENLSKHRLDPEARVDALLIAPLRKNPSKNWTTSSKKVRITGNCFLRAFCRTHPPIPNLVRAGHCFDRLLVREVAKELRKGFSQDN